MAHGEVLHRRPGGSTYPAEQTSAIVPAPGGERYTYVVFRDVTERRRAEVALRRYELLAENTRDIILFVAHEGGRIVDANRAAVEAYGWLFDRS